MAALQAKKLVYEALIVRFIIGRYGRDNIGFMWTVVEPMLFCLGVMVIWTSTKGDVTHGISVVAFVYTAYMPLTLWRHLTGSAINLGRASKHLTIFRNITIFDAIASRLFLEFVSVTAAAVIVFIALYGIGFLELPYDIGDVLVGWMALGAMSAGTGMLLASLSEMSHVVEKLNGPMQYFILPFSGCFFMVDWLPSSVRETVLFIPLVNGFEVIRGGYYGPEIPTFGSASYTFACAFVVAGFGAALFELVKDRVES